MGGRGQSSKGTGSHISAAFARLVTGRTAQEVMQDKAAMKEILRMGYNPQTFREDWYTVNFENSASNLRPLDEYDVADAMRDHIPENVWYGWVVNADSNFKPRLQEAIITNPDARNAALNVAWQNYNAYQEANGGQPLSYNSFLTRPITVYRGDTGQGTVSDDVFSAFSFDRRVAEGFGPNITTKTVRPIDTLGGIQLNAEYEIMIPNR